MYRILNPAALRLVLLLLGLFLLTPPPAVRAQTTLLSNLDATPNTGSNITSTLQKAFAFTTGTTAYSLSSIQAYLATSVTSTNFNISLFTSGGATNNDPGTLVDNLGTQTVTNKMTTPTIYTFTPSSAITLAANTRYVFLVDYVSGDDGIWGRTNPDTAPTARNSSGFNTFTYRLSSNNGASYINSTTLNLLAVNGTEVATPEPGSLALLFTSGVSTSPLAAVAVRRRKKHGK